MHASLEAVHRAEPRGNGTSLSFHGGQRSNFSFGSKSAQWGGGKCFPGGSVGRESACNTGNAGDIGWIPEQGVGGGRSPGVRHGNPLQYSCLENPTDRGAWRVTVHGVTKSRTRLKRLSRHTHAQWTGGRAAWVLFLCLCLFKVSQPFSIQQICFVVPENPILWGHQM